LSDSEWLRLTVIGKGNPDDIGRGGAFGFAKRNLALGFTVIDDVDLRKADARPKWPDEQWLRYRISDLKASLRSEEALGRNTALVHAAGRMIRYLEDSQLESQTSQSIGVSDPWNGPPTFSDYERAAVSDDVNDVSDEIRKMALPDQMRIAATILSDVTEAVYPDLKPEITGWAPDGLRDQAKGLELEYDEALGRDCIYRYSCAHCGDFWFDKSERMQRFALLHNKSHTELPGKTPKTT
jgi:hypothetical protein